MFPCISTWSAQSPGSFFCEETPARPLITTRGRVTQAESVVAASQRHSRNPKTIKENSKPPFLSQRGSVQQEHGQPRSNQQWRQSGSLLPWGFVWLQGGSLNRIFNNCHSRPLSPVPLQLSWSPFGHWKGSKVTLDLPLPQA